MPALGLPFGVDPTTPEPDLLPAGPADGPSRPLPRVASLTPAGAGLGARQTARRPGLGTAVLGKARWQHQPARPRRAASFAGLTSQGRRRRAGHPPRDPCRGGLGRLRPPCHFPPRGSISGVPPRTVRFGNVSSWTEFWPPPARDRGHVAPCLFGPGLRSLSPRPAGLAGSPTCLSHAPAGPCCRPPPVAVALARCVARRLTGPGNGVSPHGRVPLGAWAAGEAPAPGRPALARWTLDAGGPAPLRGGLAGALRA